MKKTKISIILICLIIGSMLLFKDKSIILGEGSKSENSSNIMQLKEFPEDRLYVPTQITKINKTYFIVDCFQHRVIYTDDLKNNIADWKKIDYEFAGPHSIAFDGSVYVIDNAGRNEILVFNTDFKLIQTIENVGIRPHKTVFTNNRFYVISSQNQTIYSYIKVDGKLVEEYHKTLKFLESNYTRSIKVINGKMYFIFGNNRIVVANHISGNFEVLKSYTLPNKFAGLTDMEEFNGEFYLTSMGDETYNVSPGIIKSVNLEAMAQGNYTDLYKKLNLKDKPYFMDIFDGKMFFTEVGEKQNSILSIDNDNNLTVHFRFSELLPGSIRRRELYPR